MRYLGLTTWLFALHLWLLIDFGLSWSFNAKHALYYFCLIPVVAVYIHIKKSATSHVESE